jgi:signal transduction histidine kinase
VIDNAVRHNHPGGWLSVHTVHDGHHTVIMVTNTGAEIDPARVPQLFEPFQRVDGRARSSEQGLGLGLSIMWAVALAHQAEVTAAAHPGGGLSITVRFPMLSAARPTALIPAS